MCKNIFSQYILTFMIVVVICFLALSIIVSSLVGSRNLKQLEENISSAQLTLSDDVIREIDRISQPVLDALGDCADYYESLENSRIY